MIRKTIWLLGILLSVLATSCKEDTTAKIKNADQVVVQNDVTDASYPIMKFETIYHDFGQIEEGNIVNTIFKFENEGNSELLLRNVLGSCECTVSEYPKTPINPGDTGEIKVHFDSRGKLGQQQESVTIMTNTANGSEIVSIRATVNPKAVK